MSAKSYSSKKRIFIIVVVKLPFEVVTVMFYDIELNVSMNKIVNAIFIRKLYIFRKYVYLTVLRN